MNGLQLVMFRNLKCPLPENSSLLDFLKDPTSSLPLHGVSGWICMFRVKSPTSAAKRMHWPSSMKWTLPGATGVEEEKTWKTYFRNRQLGTRWSCQMKTLLSPLGVSPTFRSACPRARFTKVTWDMKNPFTCLSLGSEWECLGKTSFLLNSCGSWDRLLVQGRQGRPVQLVGSPTFFLSIYRCETRGLVVHCLWTSFMTVGTPRTTEAVTELKQ